MGSEASRQIQHYDWVASWDGGANSGWTSNAVSSRTTREALADRLDQEVRVIGLATSGASGDLET